MIDTVRLNIKAGDGGNGCVSFLREKYRPWGGPNGGDGGNGGSIYLCGDPSFNTLLHLKFNSTIYADRGIHGKGKDRRGADADDIVIRVPVGTEVSLRHPGGDKEFLTDITDATQTLVVQGGRGGWGNARYATSTNQEPVLAERGQKGESVVLFLELKLLADVGLLARPNAGKSTLISRSSAAKPRIAAYPFTTVEPVLGVVSSRGQQFVMMEVPGLLEGAHRGVGLGHEFLRHAERARLYIHLLDGLSDDPVGDYRMLNGELLRFNPTLANKPQIVAVNKVDVTEVREQRSAIETALKQEMALENRSIPGPLESRVFFISAVTGEGVEDLLGTAVEAVSTMRKEEVLPAAAPVATVKPRRPQSQWSVRMEDGEYLVESEELEQLASLADTRDRRVLLQLWREMTRRGIARRLEELGIEAGDTIRIGKVEVEWF